MTSAGITKDSYLRKDVDDTFSGNNLTIQGRLSIRGNMDLSDAQNLDFGSSDDVRINYNTNNWLYCDFRTGNGIIFQDNGTDKMRLEDSGVFRPNTTNTGTIGTSSYYWNHGYFENFTVSDSASFAGVITGTGGLQVDRAASGSSVFIGKYNGTENITMLANGSATFAGTLSAIGFDLESLDPLP